MMFHKMGFEYQTENGLFVHDDAVEEFEAQVQHYLDDGCDRLTAERRAEACMDHFKVIPADASEEPTYQITSLHISELGRRK